jgi:hypothetical protein
MLLLLRLQADMNDCHYKGVPDTQEGAPCTALLKCQTQYGASVAFGTSGHGKSMANVVTYDLVLHAVGEERANYHSEAAFEQVGVESVLWVTVAACV